MVNHCSIVSEVGSVSEHDLNAIAIQVQDGRIEMTIFIASGGRSSVWTTASGQRGGIEVPDCRPTWGGEGNVCCAGFYAICVLVQSS